MLRFQAQIYKVNDILGWNDRQELVLSPNFQRRKVWSPQGKSFLIDSIIKGYPLPQLFIREKILTKERRTIREVVDGQQRLRTILEYIEGKFTIFPLHNEELASKRFDELSEEIQQTVLTFPLSVNTLIGTDDSDVLGLFSRLNSYSVPLNDQEKINAEFLGVFKQKIDELSKLNLAYWTNNGILSQYQFARMKEVELTAELIVGMLEGLQSGKTIIRTMYKKYDEEFIEFRYLESRFNEVLELCPRVMGGSIAETEFCRPPLFYSLFCAVYDLRYGFRSKEEIKPRAFNENALGDVQQQLYRLNQALTGEEDFPEYKEFVTASKSSTNKMKARRIRHDLMVSIIRPLFGNAV